MKEIDGFRKIALKDAEVAILLYQKQFYPHALYTLSQSVEKLRKAYLFYRGIATSYEQAKSIDRSHSAKAWIKYWEDEIELWEKMKQTEKEPSKYRTRISINPEEKIRTARNIITGISTYEKDIQEGKYTVGMALSTLDKKRDELIKWHEKSKTAHNKIIQNYQEDFSKDEELLKKKIAQEEEMQSRVIGGINLDYIFNVAYYLSFILPHQNDLRYPEHNPLETYTNDHPLVKNFELLSQHVLLACKMMMELEFDGTFLNRSGLKKAPLTDV